MLISILIIFVAVAALLLAAAVRFGFRYDREVKEIFLSYLLLRAVIDFREMNIRISLAGINIKQLDLKGGEKRAEVKKEKPEAPKKKRKFRRPEFGWSDLNLLKSLIEKFHIKYLALNISGGFSDPYETGKYFGIYTAVSGILPKIMRHINFRPDFTTDILHFDGKGLIYVRPYALIFWILKVVIKKRKSLFGESLYLKKKGASYA
ncbi:hypothetical protein TRIP_C20794 [Candidatus Zixiibacteriota bacterium]|nr:hypothetical protein TRIP_C20794 [candidate division Zixibacteria bacterium]